MTSSRTIDKHSPPHASSSVNPRDMFWDENHYNTFLASAGQKILTGSSVTPEFLKTHGFNTILEDFKFQGWVTFLSLHNDYNPKLVRQFYANFKESGEDDSVQTMVNGTSYLFSRNSLYRYLVGCTNQLVSEESDHPLVEGGACPDHSNWKDHYENYSYQNALKSLRETNTYSNSVTELSVENRLLHHIVTRTIVPRSGSYSTVTEYDAGLMFFIRNRIKLDLPFIMLQHMRDDSRSKRRNFSYAMHLTGYFSDETSPSNLKKPDALTGTYNLSTLSKLFIKKDGQWSRRYKVASVASTSTTTTPQNMDEQQDEDCINAFTEDVPRNSAPTPTLLDIHQECIAIRADMTQMEVRLHAQMQAHMKTLLEETKRAQTPTLLDIHQECIAIRADMTKMEARLQTQMHANMETLLEEMRRPASRIP